MIIQPVPASPRNPRRRIAQVAGVVAPVALLALIVAGALLGGSGATATGVDGVRATGAIRSAASSPAAADPASPAGTRPPTGGTVDGSDTTAGRGVTEVGGATAFPSVAAGLAVRSVVDALAGRDDPGAGRPIAVAGFLGILDPPADCEGGRLGPLGPLCERTGVLAQIPWSLSGGAAFAALGPHLHPRFPIGVSLPAGIAHTTTEAGGAPIPVVVIGSFDPTPGSCDPEAGPCDAGFLVDGVGWADGAPTRVSPVLDAGLDIQPTDWILRNERVAEVAAIGWAGTILTISLVRPATVPGIDPSAGAALAAVSPRPAGLVWYVRGLETGYDSVGYPFGHAPPRLTWVVLDDTTGEVLARSREDQPAS